MKKVDPPACRGAVLLWASALILCLYAPPVQAVDEGILALEFTVSNAASSAEEVGIHVPMPKGLRMEDFISTDGLGLEFEDERQAYAVTGKVVLQGGETTLYRVRVKDIWMIDAAQIARYRAAASTLPDMSRARLLDLLGKIERDQQSTRNDVKAHITAYQQNRAQLAEFDALLVGTASARLEPEPKAWRYALAVLGGILLALLLTRIIRPRRAATLPAAPADPEKVRYDRRRSDRIIEPRNVECRLLFSPEGMPSAEEISVTPKDLSEGGICLELTEPFRAQSVVEIKMKLPVSPDPLTFRGAIVWQKKVVGEDPNLYMTGISLGEASYEDYEQLRAYVKEQIR